MSESHACASPSTDRSSHRSRPVDNIAVEYRMRELRRRSRNARARSASFIDGADSDNVGNHTCEDEMRRRRLLTVGGVDVSFTISVDTAQHEESESVQGSVQAQLTQAESSGALQQAVIVAATAANVSAMTKVTSNPSASSTRRSQQPRRGLRA